MSVPIGTTSAPGATSSDYSDFEKPAIWRTRESAQSKVAAMEDTGSDRYDIPAFLRKQAD